MVNEQEIKTALERNDWERIGRLADMLAVHHHMSIKDILDLFARLGGDRELLAREFHA